MPERHRVRDPGEDRSGLAALDAEWSTVYAYAGSLDYPRIPAACNLLRILYSVRSERLMVEQTDCNLLFRWFIGLSMDDPVWDQCTFIKNWDRLSKADVARRFFSKAVAQGRMAKLLSDEDCNVDCTQQRHPCLPDGSRGAAVPQDPRPRCADLRYQSHILCQSHILMENRNGLIVDHELTSAGGTGERTAAVDMVTRLPGYHRVTVGAARGYDTGRFIDPLRCLNVTPHIAQSTMNRRPAIGARTTLHPGHTVSQASASGSREENFGWDRVVGPLRRARAFDGR